MIFLFLFNVTALDEAVTDLVERLTFQGKKQGDVRLNVDHVKSKKMLHSRLSGVQNQEYWRENIPSSAVWQNGVKRHYY